MEICNVCNEPIKSIPYGDTACVMCRPCSDTEKGIRMFMDRKRVKRENVKLLKIPVFLYLLSGLLWFPFWTGIVTAGYFQQKSLIRSGDYEKANKSIRMATVSSWWMSILGTIVVATILLCWSKLNMFFS